VPVTGVDSPYRNEILAALPAEELERLLPLLTRVEWENGQPLQERDQPILYMYLVEKGFASIVADADGAVEVGLAGRESMIGFAALLDPNAVSFNRVFVQTPGGAFRAAASDMRANIHAMPTLQLLLFRALQAQMAQSAQTAACNVQHGLPERLARWLLLAHDRTEGNELHLTQTFLAVMLAVRRSGVTKAAAALQKNGLIENHRGRIVIEDRSGLEAAACDCYRRVKQFIALISSRVR
jgi:CRP-like cAMP-binding protein